MAALHAARHRVQVHPGNVLLVHGFTPQKIDEHWSMTRAETFVLLWRGSTVIAQSRMGNMLDMKDVLADWRAKP